MSLALWKTWGLKMRTSQKISLSSLYCLVVALMVFDIVRIVESLVYRSWTRSSFFDILELVLTVIITALPGYRSALGGNLLDKAYQHITSLASSSKKSIIHRLGRSSSHDTTASDQEAVVRDSGSTSRDLELLEAKEAQLGFAPVSHGVNVGDESFRGCIEGV